AGRRPSLPFRAAEQAGGEYDAVHLGAEVATDVRGRNGAAARADDVERQAGVAALELGNDNASIGRLLASLAIAVAQLALIRRAVHHHGQDAIAREFRAGAWQGVARAEGA